MKNVTVIGAGKTGRGFIGRLLAESGRSIYFIDKDKELVDKLNKDGKFTVSFFGGKREALTVENFKAVTWDDADLSETELIIISVGGSNLTDVSEEIKKRTNDGKKRYIITAENAKHPSETVKEVLTDGFNIAESTVFCTTIENGGLDINSENYPYLQFDADKLMFNPEIPALKPVNNFGNLLERKLFTYNAASCIIAYLGFLKGYTDYGEAANDGEILSLLDKNYAETNRVLCEIFGYTKEDQNEFALLSKAKFCDRTISDTVARNAREPQRKLQSGERIMGPLTLMYEKGADVSVLVLTAAAMLLYYGENEEAWEKIKADNSDEEILEKISGLKKDSPLSKMILGKEEELKNYLSFDSTDKKLPL